MAGCGGWHGAGRAALSCHVRPCPSEIRGCYCLGQTNPPCWDAGLVLLPVPDCVPHLLGFAPFKNTCLGLNLCCCRAQRPGWPRDHLTSSPETKPLGQSPHTLALKSQFLSPGNITGLSPFSGIMSEKAFCYCHSAPGLTAEPNQMGVPWSERGDGAGLTPDKSPPCPTLGLSSRGRGDGEAFGDQTPFALDMPSSRERPEEGQGLRPLLSLLDLQASLMRTRSVLGAARVTSGDAAGRGCRAVGTGGTAQPARHNQHGAARGHHGSAAPRMLSEVLAASAAPAAPLVLARRRRSRSTLKARGMLYAASRLA